VRDRASFEYVVVRVVPRVEREEFLNAGAIVFCEARDYLAADVSLDEARLLSFAPGVDLDVVRRHLAALPVLCAGGSRAGPIGALPIRERWRWLTAPRSTIVQTSPAHAGLCDAPEDALAQVMRAMVRLAASP